MAVPLHELSSNDYAPDVDNYRIVCDGRYSMLVRNAYVTNPTFVSLLSSLDNRSKMQWLFDHVQAVRL